jgi:hypothetical protein
MKFKFYQPKRPDFTKMYSPVTLEFDLVFYIYIGDFFEIVNSEFSSF